MSYHNHDHEHGHGPGDGMGAGGNCICPKCGYVKPHERGTPCREERCPKCNAKMLRQGSYHHQKVEEVKAKRREKEEKNE